MTSCTRNSWCWSVALTVVAACGAPEGTQVKNKPDGAPSTPVSQPKPAKPSDSELKPERFELGEYMNPLVQLKRLEGQNKHLHVDEVRLRPDGLLLQCSYTFGVVDTTDAAKMTYLAQMHKHAIPNDERTPGCVHLAWDGDIVYTTHRGNIRNPAFLSGWDITDRAKPVQIPVLQEPGVSYEGVDVSQGHVFVALHEQGLGVYRADKNHQLTRVAKLEGFTNAWGVTARDDTLFVADGIGGLVTVDISEPAQPKILGKVTTGGQARAVALNGSTAYIAAGSEGLIVVDVSNLAQPKILSKTSVPGTAMRLDYSEGRVFIAAWNDARVYDVSTPAQPKFIGAVRLTEELSAVADDRPPSTSRVLGIAARGNDVFVGNWHVLYSYRLYADRKAPNIRLPEAAAMVDFGSLEAGNTKQVDFQIFNQGTAPLTIVDAWVSDPAYTVKPESLRIPAGERASIQLSYRAEDKDTRSAYLQLHSDDPAAPLRTAYLIANQPGLGVGSMMPETTGAMMDGSDWASSEMRGDVVLLNYFATFCPVCGGQLPDIEERFWLKYRDKGLRVVALNAHDAQEQVGQVQSYLGELRVSFPTGLETSSTYKGITANFIGINPFPVDVLIDKTGRIVYIAREYDPEAITSNIERLLAE